MIWHCAWKGNRTEKGQRLHNLPGTEELYWLELSLTPGWGARRIHQLAHRFGSLSEAIEAEGQGKETKGISEFSKGEESLKKAVQLRKAKRVWEQCAKQDIGILTPASSAYPFLLAQIYDPPAALYYWGDAEVLKAPAMAVVGSRRCTSYGAQAAESIARCLAEGGITVVSGMARGIDRYSHEGALKGGGYTIAVLGCGIDICYPAEHQKLRQQILERGLILSEFPPGIGVKARYFPMRNRIISGLSKGVIVAEAGEKSGSLITADMALDQNREVYCVPGSFFSSANIGGHRLLQQGASLLGSISEVQNLCGMKALTTPKKENKEMHWLLKELSDFGSTPEQLCRNAGRSPEQVQQAITFLQIKGKIRIGPDHLIMKVQE